jgi:hypothetical protein
LRATLAKQRRQIFPNKRAFASSAQCGKKNARGTFVRQNTVSQPRGKLGTMKEG